MAVIAKKSGEIEYLVAENIATPHCFTTRLGGVSGGIFGSLNLGLHRAVTEIAHLCLYVQRHGALGKVEVRAVHIHYWIRSVRKGKDLRRGDHVRHQQDHHALPR